MKIDKTQVQFITLSSFGGISQRQDMDQISDNYSPLTVNVSNDKPGTWSKRNGIPQLGSTRSGGIKGLIEWNANTAAMTNANQRVRYFRGTNVAGRNNLETVDVSNGTFNINDTSQTVIDYVDSVNYIDRVYHISPSNYLSYETGSALAQVATANIRGKCLATAQNTLFVGNVNVLNSIIVDYQSRVYYSDFTSNIPTDNFYDTAKGQNITNTTNYFTVLAPVVGLFNFSATGLLYVFTRDACYSFDVRLLENRIGPLKKFNIGLINKKAICECNGAMYWMDYEGRIWSWSGYGLPQNVSWELQDDENGEAVLSQLDRSNLNAFAAGTIYNKIYFSLGQSLITYKGQTVANPVLRGLLTQNMQSITWGIDDFPVKPAMFTTTIINNSRKLVFGSLNTDDIYYINSGTNDGTNIAINAYANTKFLDFGLQLYRKQFLRLLIKYKPQPVAGTYLVVKWAVDGVLPYTTLSDPTYVGGGSPATGTAVRGTIDMNIGYTSTSFFYTQALELPNECIGKSISVQVGNSKVNQRFEVSAIGIEFVIEDYDISPRSS